MRIVYKGNYIRMMCGEIDLVCFNIQAYYTFIFGGYFSLVLFGVQ